MKITRFSRVEPFHGNKIFFRLITHILDNKVDNNPSKWEGHKGH